MSQSRPELFLHEQVMLLALRDEKGTIESRAGWYSLAMGGALLSDLMLAECIRIDGGKKKLVERADGRALDERILDECLDLVVTAKRRRSAQDWVGRFSRVRRLRHRVAEGLCRRGILKDDEDKVLLLFRRKIYPTLDPGPERRLVQKLRRAIFEESKTLNPRTSILVALANATGLIHAHFSKKELKPRKKRLERIGKGDLASGATRDAVQAAQAAALIATTAAITASVAASTAAASG